MRSEFRRFHRPTSSDANLWQMLPQMLCVIYRVHKILVYIILSTWANEIAGTLKAPLTACLVSVLLWRGMILKKSIVLTILQENSFVPNPRITHWGGGAIVREWIPPWSGVATSTVQSYQSSIQLIHNMCTASGYLEFSWCIMGKKVDNFISHHEINT